MGSECKCLVCGDNISSKNYAISRHVKKHETTFNEYIIDHYTLIGGNYEKCGFCDKDAVPIFEISHNKKEYRILINDFAKYGYISGRHRFKDKFFK